MLKANGKYIFSPIVAFIFFLTVILCNGTVTVCDGFTVRLKNLNIIPTNRVKECDRERLKWRYDYHLSAVEQVGTNLVNPSEEDGNARSQFGTFEYWDQMYSGMGDFPPDEYSWYYGWETLKPIWMTHVADRALKILIPGVGNDPILVDLLQAGFKDLTAFDYTESAVERQSDILSFETAAEGVRLLVRDARQLDEEWTQEFDAILEKGALDAIYLSGDGNLEKAVLELTRVTKTGGVCISISGVVPDDLRRQVFDNQEWDWVRDGTTDLKAGCFVFRRR
mmetsp:Transcript_6513/g.11637  ORF Transcript_6513/g.11637 Transcript_6513/m.11637 type:complete len:280 (-) Transcript_6513:68-907(-)